MALIASRGAGDKAAPSFEEQRVTTPIVLQMHASECGAACLAAFSPTSDAGFAGGIAERCEVSRDGSSAASIARASRHYGLECTGLSVRAGQLKRLQLPLIVFWQFSHFVVLEGFDSRHFYLNDPSTGRRRLSAEEFGKGYSGIALRFKRGSGFESGGEPPGLYTQLGTLLPDRGARLPG